MIELRDDALVFSFPEVHSKARLSVQFERTLRIPDDGNDHPLPPGLGAFPLRHVDDFAAKVPSSWLQHGGVMLPMYQSEAMWLMFHSNATWVDDRAEYPFAIKIATGKICAVTGSEWTSNLQAKPQNYVVTPGQPWLDGYCVEKGIIRQFVTTPLGAGYTAEEQITGKAEHGGLQIMAYPMKREVYEKRFHLRFKAFECPDVCSRLAEYSMGLAPGGRMRQEIYEDPFGINDWDVEHSSRCFIHIANSLVWRAITGAEPPNVPLTAAEYTKAGLPWFDYYSENGKPLNGSKTLKNLQSVHQLGKEKGTVPLPENEPVTPANIITIRDGLMPGQVREGRF